VIRHRPIQTQNWLANLVTAERRISQYVNPTAAINTTSTSEFSPVLNKSAERKQNSRAGVLDERLPVRQSPATAA